MQSNLQYQIALDHVVFYVVHSRVCGNDMDIVTCGQTQHPARRGKLAATAIFHRLLQAF